MKYLKRHALEGKIKFEVSQEELAFALDVSPYGDIPIDEATKKYFKSKGIRIIDCDLRVAQSGIALIKKYKKERKKEMVLVV